MTKPQPCVGTWCGQLPTFLPWIQAKRSECPLYKALTGDGGFILRAMLVRFVVYAALALALIGDYR